MNNILIIGQQRTGTTNLQYALSFFDNYRNCGELFSVDENNFIYKIFWSKKEIKKLYSFYKTKNWRKLLHKINKDPLKSMDFFDHLYPSNKIIKLLDHQIEKYPQIINIIQKNNNIIIVNRKDTLAQFVSWAIANKTQVWTDRDTSNDKIILDINQYIEFKNRKKKFYHMVDTHCNNKNVLKINYEDDLINGITDTLLENLQVITKSRYQDKNRNYFMKQNKSNDVSQQIINWHDVKEFIQNS